MESAKEEMQRLKSQALEREAYIKHLEMLVKHFGFCHPDLQIARLDQHEAYQKYKEMFWRRENDPKMPAYKSREVAGR